MESSNIENIENLENEKVEIGLGAIYRNLLCQIAYECNVKIAEIVRDAIAVNVLVRHFEKEGSLSIDRPRIDSADPRIIILPIKRKSYLAIKGYVKDNNLESIQNFIIESIVLYLDMIGGEIMSEGKYIYQKNDEGRVEIFMGDIAKKLHSKL